MTQVLGAGVRTRGIQVHGLSSVTRVPGVISRVAAADLLVHGGVPHEEEAEEPGRPVPGGVGAQLGRHYGHLQKEGEGRVRARVRAWARG